MLDQPFQELGYKALIEDKLVPNGLHFIIGELEDKRRQAIIYNESDGSYQPDPAFKDISDVLLREGKLAYRARIDYEKQAIIFHERLDGIGFSEDISHLAETGRLMAREYQCLHGLDILEGKPLYAGKDAEGWHMVYGDFTSKGYPNGVFYPTIIGGMLAFIGCIKPIVDGKEAWRIIWGGKESEIHVGIRAQALVSGQRGLMNRIREKDGKPAIKDIKTRQIEKITIRKSRKKD